MGKRKMSSVWSYYTNNKTLAKCKECKKEYRTSGNTSNLQDHLKRMHPEIQNAIVEPGDEDSERVSSHSIAKHFKKQNVYDRDSHHKNEIDKGC